MSLESREESSRMLGSWRAPSTCANINLLNSPGRPGGAEKCSPSSHLSHQSKAVNLLQTNCTEYRRQTDIHTRREQAG